MLAVAAAGENLESIAVERGDARGPVTETARVGGAG